MKLAGVIPGGLAAGRGVHRKDQARLCPGKLLECSRFVDEGINRARVFALNLLTDSTDPFSERYNLSPRVQKDSVASALARLPLAELPSDCAV